MSWLRKNNFAYEDRRTYLHWFDVTGSKKPIFHTNNSGWTIPIYRFYTSGDYFKVYWSRNMLYGYYIRPSNEYHIQKTMLEYILEQLPDDVTKSCLAKFGTLSIEPPKE